MPARSAGAEVTLAVVLHKAQFWERLCSAPLNERQRLALKRLLDELDGKLTSSKWAKVGDFASIAGL